LETFETCGIFFQDFQSNSSEQRGDSFHGIIEHLQLKTNNPQSLILKNAISRREIHPKIFRSMTYDCFLHVHYFNNGNDLFSTIPPFDNPSQKRLYQRRLYLIFVSTNPFKMFTKSSLSLQLDRQQRVFVVRIEETLCRKKRRTKPFVFSELYFFCQFCQSGLVRFNAMSMGMHFSSLKLTSFEKNWVTDIANHCYQVYPLFKSYNEEFCRHMNLMYIYKKETQCMLHDFLAQLILSASGRNLTLKLKFGTQLDFSKKPQIFIYDYFSGAEDPYMYYEYPSVMHCFNLGKVTIAETNMWTKYVP